MSDLHKFYDPISGKSWLVNVRTRVVRDRDGAFPDDAEAARILKRVESRRRSAATRKVRDQILRDTGLVRVRGNLGGTYWE